MKDRFKFRVWDGEKMHYPYNVSFYDNDTWIAFGLNVNPVTGYGSEFEITHSNKGKLMACTGLKDRNGDLIWEGDLCNITFGMGITHENCEVKYIEDSGFRAVYTHPCGVKVNHSLTNNIVDVIGNIYEKPDLLT